MNSIKAIVWTRPHNYAVEKTSLRSVAKQVWHQVYFEMYFEMERFGHSRENGHTISTLVRSEMDSNE